MWDMPSTLRSVLALAPLAVLLVAGCAAPADDAAEEESAPTTTDGALTQSGVTLLWEGNWDFLVKCDSYSKSQKAVMFTCDEHPSRSYVDDEKWVAAPRNAFSRSMCNKTARVCKGSRCVEAEVIERSVTSNKWEASSAVMEALGVDAGFTSCTHSWGSVTGVTVTVR